MPGTGSRALERRDPKLAKRGRLTHAGGAVAFSSPASTGLSSRVSTARIVVTGELVEVRRAMPGARDADGPGASRRTHISARGGGARRSPVGFSEASRLRLRRRVLSLRPERPAFLTLTYPDPSPTSPETWGRDWKAFADRLRRRFPSSAAVWALHLARRLTGSQAGLYAPHRHALVYVPGGIDGATLEALRAFCGEAWGEIAGGRAHVALARDPDGIRARLYLVAADKTTDADERAALASAFPGGTGRPWGVVNGSALPVASSRVAVVSDADAAAILREMRDEVDGRMEGTGRRSRLSPDLFAASAHAPALASRLVSTGFSSRASSPASTAAPTRRSDPGSGGLVPHTYQRPARPRREKAENRPMRVRSGVYGAVCQSGGSFWEIRFLRGSTAKREGVWSLEFEEDSDGTTPGRESPNFKLQTLCMSAQS